MVKEKVILKNETGLHARPAGELAKKAASFKSSIKLTISYILLLEFKIFN